MARSCSCGGCCSSSLLMEHFSIRQTWSQLRLLSSATFFDRHLAAEPADAVFKTLGKPGRFCQPCQRFVLHGFALRAGNPPVFERTADAGCSGIQVSNHVRAPIPKA